MQVVFKVQRYQPERDGQPYFQSFPLELPERATVLDGLHQIKDERDGSLSFRRSCRSAICGSCAMYINGAYHLACNTGVETLKAQEIVVSPLPHLRVIKDLIVDMQPFFEKFERALPYLMTTTPPPERERLQSPEQRRAFEEMINCIQCAACYSACPMVWTDPQYLGPAALTKVYRFVSDSRDEVGRQRLALVDNDHGVWRCHTIFNCHIACPKNINPTWSIQQLKRKTIARRLRFWERG
ncbi:MAG: succinate dehydrogenase iron-sulfur subunit [Chloroflexi bacterium]|nr:succinate dehydrogenase iron-sulfur subunit [Chloroflexota bacterium]